MIQNTPTFLLKRESSNLVKFKSNALVFYYLRFHLHGFKDDKIAEKLNISQNSFKEFKKRLIKQYQVKNWPQVIEYAFKFEHINKIDFIEEPVKKELLRQASYFTNKINKEEIEKVFIVDILKLRIISFYREYDDKLSSQYTRKKNLLQKNELNYLRLKCLPTNKEEAPKSISKIMESRISKKLKAANRFTLFKKAFHYRLFGTSIKNLEAFEANVELCAEKIFKIRLRKDIGQKEKKSMIYNGLLHFYSNIEFNNILDIMVNDTHDKSKQQDVLKIVK